jgi:hypothetical protein
MMHLCADGGDSGDIRDTLAEAGELHGDAWKYQESSSDWFNTDLRQLHLQSDSDTCSQLSSASFDW